VSNAAAQEVANRVSTGFERGGFRLEVDLAWSEHVTVVFGPSGSGKSTLFEVMLGLHPKARPRVRLGNAWLEDPARGLRVPTHERGLGWVPQDPTLFPHLSVEGNLRFGQRHRAAGADARVRQAVRVLELAGLLERPVSDLSGGERQRVAIGRALAAGPRALLLDEPLSSLDVGLRARVLPYLLRVREELDVPIVAITHDPDEALLLGERVIVLNAGTVVAAGPPREVLWSRAVLPLSAALGLENVFEGRIRGGSGDETVLETARGLRLSLPVRLAPGEEACIGLRAEDVLLAADPPGRISARNVWEARVTDCALSGEDAFVTLESPAGGERLVAKLTPAAAAMLELRPGASVYAVVKAQALRRIA